MSRKTSEENISNIVSLRKKGYSIQEISKELFLPKTTVCKYVRGVKVALEYKNQWLSKRGGSTRRMLLEQEAAYEYALDKVGVVSDKELLLFIAALYWAEGSKDDFGLSNTDPMLIKTFMRGLTSVLHVDRSDFRVSIRTYEDLDREKCIKYWMEVTNLPRSQIISVNVLYGKKSGKLEYGMCRVRVKKGGTLLKKMKGLRLAVASSLANNTNI